MPSQCKIKVLVCGVLPPPTFGHSMLYQMLMRSSFVDACDIRFLNMHFWSYATNKKITVQKLLRLIWYFLQYVVGVVVFRPKYILYNISFYKMPFLKDFLFCATGILLGRKVVIHDHGQYVRELHDALPGWQKPLLRWMLKHMAASIVMGEKVRKVYEGLADPEKVFVVPGVVEDTKSVATEPDRQAGMLNVLYFSHMSRPKGVLTAFEAAVFILDARVDVAFTFAGPIEDDVIARKLEALKSVYPGRVRYLGYIEDVRARTAIFRGADVFMFPTLRDVFGLVLLHAMSEGKSVVASYEGTIPEIVIDGQTGLLFEKGNAKACAQCVLRLLADDAMRIAMSCAARQRFENVFALDKYGAAMTRVFDEMEKCS